MNPTKPRLRYIAKESSPWVMKLVIAEWLAAIGQERLWGRGSQQRSATYLTGEQVYTAAHMIPAIREKMAQSSIVDPYLPWFAAYLRRKEKEFLKKVRNVGWEALQDPRYKDAINLEPRIRPSSRNRDYWVRPGEFIQRVRTSRPSVIPGESSSSTATLVSWARR